MSCGYIRIAGEDYPKKREKCGKTQNNPYEDISPESAAKLANPDWFPSYADYDYKIILTCAGRKLPIFEGKVYREAYRQFRKLRHSAIKSKTIVKILFYSNDFLVEKYERE